MKKVTMGLLSSTVLATTLFGAEASLKDLTEMQNFYYNKGVKDASEKMYMKGYEQAVFDLTGAMQKYRKIIDSYEAGKYYMQNNKITFPRIFSSKDVNGNYIIHIEPPEVKEKMTLQDIFLIPQIENNSQIMRNNFGGSYTSNGSYSVNVGNNVIPNPLYSAKSNAIHPARNSTANISTPISIMKEFGVSFPKTDRIKRVLESGSIKYVESPDEYKGYFKTEQEYKTFCKSVSGNETCQNLMGQR